MRFWMLAAVLFLLPVERAEAKFCLCLQCALGTHTMFYAAASSMEPALMEGQCLLVEKLDAPSAEEIRPGDIVTFLKSTGPDVIFIKRVIAVGGDRVAVADGIPLINGVPAVQTALPAFERLYARREGGGLPRCADTSISIGDICRIDRAVETLSNGVRYEVLDLGVTRFDFMSEITVPEGHVFMLGDNRDNSLDSRVPADIGGVGMVRLDQITGRHTPDGT